MQLTKTLIVALVLSTLSLPQAKAEEPLSQNELIAIGTGEMVAAGGVYIVGRDTAARLMTVAVPYSVDLEKSILTNKRYEKVARISAGVGGLIAQPLSIVGGVLLVVDGARQAGQNLVSDSKYTGVMTGAFIDKNSPDYLLGDSEAKTNSAR